MWAFDNHTSIHNQICAKILADIAASRLRAGDKMASVRELAAEAGVNPNTMQKALLSLEERGYLKSERTQGRYVTSDEGLIGELKDELLRDIAETTRIKLREMGLTKADFIKYLELMEEEQNV